MELSAIIVTAKSRSLFMYRAPSQIFNRVLNTEAATRKRAIKIRAIKKSSIKRTVYKSFLKACNFIKKRLQHVFSCNIAKF